MKKLLLASLALATMTLAACNEVEQPTPGATSANYVEAVPYPDGTQK